MKIRIPDDVLWSEVGDDVVLLNLASGNYFGLDGVAGRIWNLIVAEASAEQIATTIEQEFEVEGERARRDLHSLLQDLADEGLVSLESDR